MRMKEFRKEYRKEVEKAKEGGRFKIEKYRLYLISEDVLRNVILSLPDKDFIMVIKSENFKEKIQERGDYVLVFRGCPMHNIKMEFFKEIDDCDLIDMLDDDVDVDCLNIIFVWK